jgi:hypothetical protein
VGLNSLKSLNLTNGYPNKNKNKNKNNNKNNNKVKSKPLEPRSRVKIPNDLSILTHYYPCKSWLDVVFFKKISKNFQILFFRNFSKNLKKNYQYRNFYRNFSNFRIFEKPILIFRIFRKNIFRKMDNV